MLSISFKEILFIGAIIGAFIWMRMARESMDQRTSVFIRKLRGPGPGRTGFGWRGLLVAFIIGMVCCCLFGLAAVRLITFFESGASE